MWLASVTVGKESLIGDGPKNDSIVVDTVDCLAFAAHLTNSEVIAEVLMLIRIRAHEKMSKDMQVSD